MSFGVCECPEPAALRTINSFKCPQDLKQIQKFLVQRRQDSDSPPFAALADAQTLDAWQDFLDAADETKIVITPFIEGFKIPPGEAILEGGDTNETIDGAPIAVGAKTPRTEGKMRSIPSNVLLDLKALNCELDVVVFLINQDGKIIGQSDATGDGFEGIPVQSMFIGDPGNDGLNTSDKTPINFSLRAGWADKLKFVTPSDFNARFDLNAAAS